MRLLVDVDALCKLAHWQLLDELPTLAQCTWGDIATVSTLRHRAARASAKPDGKLFHDCMAAARAVSTIDRMGALPAADESMLGRLQAIAQIDPGEAVLLGVAAVHDALLLTGDKRAIKGFAAHASTQDRAALGGKIVCIEQMLAAVLEMHGIDWLRERLCPYLRIDKVVLSVMGSRCDASVESVAAGLSSYIDEIKQASSGLLVAGRFGV